MSVKRSSLGNLLLLLNLVLSIQVIETHPETIVDLRLARPWPALQKYAEEYKIKGIDSMEHSHIPYVVILLRKLQEWKQSHDGHLPIPSKDRKAFTNSINEFRQTDNADAENIDEALEALGQHVWRPISAGDQGKIPSTVQALFKDDACNNISGKVRQNAASSQCFNCLDLYREIDFEFLVDGEGASQFRRARRWDSATTWFFTGYEGTFSNLCSASTTP